MSPARSFRLFGHGLLLFAASRCFYSTSAMLHPPGSKKYRKGPEPFVGPGPVLRVYATYVTAAPGGNPHAIRPTIIMRAAAFLFDIITGSPLLLHTKGFLLILGGIIVRHCLFVKHFVSFSGFFLFTRFFDKFFGVRKAPKGQEPPGALEYLWGGFSPWFQNAFRSVSLRH